jgi:hypothetical protein
MQKHAYRCNKCLNLEERHSTEGHEPLYAAPCSQCGGLAIKLPASLSMSRIFGELEQLSKEKGEFVISERNV